MSKKVLSFLIVGFACLFTSCSSAKTAQRSDESKDESEIVIRELKALGYVESEHKKDNEKIREEDRVKEELNSLGYLK